MKLSPFWQGVASMFQFFPAPSSAIKKVRQDLNRSPEELWAEDWHAIQKDFEKVLGEKP